MLYSAVLPSPPIPLFMTFFFFLIFYSMYMNHMGNRQEDLHTDTHTDIRWIDPTWTDIYKFRSFLHTNRCRQTCSKWMLTNSLSNWTMQRRSTTLLSSSSAPCPSSRALQPLSISSGPTKLGNSSACTSPSFSSSLIVFFLLSIVHCSLLTKARTTYAHAAFFLFCVCRVCCRCVI